MNIEELKNLIEKEWKISDYMEINGFTFYMEKHDSLVTNHLLVIYDKETNKTVTSILFTKIRSLIIDNEVIF